jgi:hypothetical protein
MSILGQAMGRQRPHKPNFFYPTIDPRCIPPLLAHVPAGTVFAEPCAGAGDLVQLLEAAGLVCDWGLELEPQTDCLRNRWPIGVGNALTLSARDLRELGSIASVFISNLPWEVSWLHPLIVHLSAILPLWSLHNASWASTQQAARIGPICTDVVAVGRLKWFPDRPPPLRESCESEAEHLARVKKHRSYDPPDDCAWYRFDAVNPSPTRYHWRTHRGAGARAGAGQLALL